MCVLIILHLLVIIKRNNLLTTISLYCIPVGKFDKKRFDFIQEISKMEHLVSTAGQLQTIADLYSSTVQLPEEDTFLELVKLSDAAKQNQYTFDQFANKLIIKNNNYNGIVEAAHDRLGPLIEDLTTDTAEIYIHNPS